MSYEYADPAATGPPITAGSVRGAWQAGRSARNRRAAGAVPINPYKGQSQTLDEVWRAGYQYGTPRARQLARLADIMESAGDLTPLPDEQDV